jgi:hypothetical protein
MAAARAPDRSRDVSQPLDRLGPDETLKADSDYLRGTIKESLADEITAAVAAGDAKLMKFFGLYQQDDGDIRDERRRQKLEAAYSFMTGVRLPGGVCSPAQWLGLDALARTYGNATLRLTTRQTFQLHPRDEARPARRHPGPAGGPARYQGGVRRRHAWRDVHRQSAAVEAPCRGLCARQAGERPCHTQDRRLR